MDVDQAGTTITTIETGDASVIVETLTDLIIDTGGMTATGDLTVTVTGDIAIGTGTGTAIEPGLAAVARVRTHSCTVRSHAID